MYIIRYIIFSYYLEARQKLIEETHNKINLTFKKKNNTAKKKKEDIFVGEKVFIKIPHKVNIYFVF